MRTLFLTLSLIYLFTACTSKNNHTGALTNFIPESSSLVLKINDYPSLKAELASNEIIAELKTTQVYSKVSTKLKPLNYLHNQKEGLLSFSAIDSASFDFIYITKDSIIFNAQELDKLKNKSTHSQTTKNITVTTHEFDSLVFYTSQIKDLSILSTSKILLGKVIANHEDANKNNTLNKFIKISNSDKILNIWVDFKHGQSLLSQISYDDLTLKELTNTMSLDLTLDNSEILLSGIAIPDSTSNQTLNLLSTTKPVANELAAIAPKNSNSLKSYSFNDFRLYSQHPNQIEKVTDSLLNTVEEIGLAEVENEKILFLKTFGTATLLEYINTIKNHSEEVSGSDIWELNKDLSIFKPIRALIGNTSFNYGGLIGNTFLFGETKKSLESTLISFKNGNVFEKSNLYSNAKTNLGDNATMQSITNFNGALRLINKSISKQLASDLKTSKLKNKVFGSQFASDNNFFHTQVFIKNITKQASRHSVSQIFEKSFKTDLATLPQFVINHNNKKKEVVVQDQDNILYLISNKGKTLWSKQLEGTIQGKIEQVDLYKNGKLQLAFTTNNQFLILDRNGKEVEPFTISFDGGNLNPLAVFDYENNKDYRFLITQNKNLFMYNKKGKKVKGFKYNKATSNITSTPKHFRIGKKDYIAFQLENGNLKIVNRVGSDRIKTKNKFLFSENGLRLYQKKFSFTTTDGYLQQIDTKGGVAKTNLFLANDHGMDATSRTLAVITDNVLKIKDKKVALELGVYSKPTIFYLNDKIYVTVTDLQNQKIYLYDSQAKPIPNFPIYGSSIIDMADIDNDKRPEFVFKDQDNSIKVYKIQ